MFKTSLLVFVLLFVSVLNVSAGIECVFPDNPDQKAPDWVCGMMGEREAVGSGDSKIEALFFALNEIARNGRLYIENDKALVKTLTTTDGTMENTIRSSWKIIFGSNLLVKGGSALPEGAGNSDEFETNSELIFKHNSCKLFISHQGTLSQSTFTISKKECFLKDFYQELGNLGFSTQEIMSPGGMHYVNLTFVDPGTK